MSFLSKKYLKSLMDKSYMEYYLSLMSKGKIPSSDSEWEKLNLTWLEIMISLKI